MSYWLFDWLERNRVTDLEIATRVIGDLTTISEMHEVATQWRESITGPQLIQGRTLVAAGGLDFIPGRTCYTPECRHHQVDRLFRRTWHYFDSTILADNAGRLVQRLTSRPEDHLRSQLLGEIATALYIRQIGAECLTEFVPTPTVDSQLIATTLTTASPNDLGGIAIELAAHYIAEHAKKEVTDRGTEFEIVFEELGGRTYIFISEEDLATNPSVDASILAASAMARFELQVLLPRVELARELNASIGVAYHPHQYILQKSSPAPAPLAVGLPVLDNVPIDVLLRLRADPLSAYDCETAPRV